MPASIPPFRKQQRQQPQEREKTLLFNHTEWDQRVGLSTCRHQLEIKANTRGNRPRREGEERKAPLNTLQTQPGLLKG